MEETKLNGFCTSLPSCLSVLCRESLGRGRGRVWVVVGAGLTIRVVGVYCSSALVFGEELLHFPVVHPGSHRELEVFLGDRIPVLSSRR